MSVTGDQVANVLATVLSAVPETEIRLVGTAACLLRGIDLPTGDVDVLFRERAAVDTWVARLSDGHEIDTAPRWEEDTSQYFARVIVADVPVELSTVEIGADSDTIECFGDGPWKHFALVTCHDQSVPAVALELRLITELARGREDRYRPIMEHLRSVRYDEDLVRRGLANLGVKPTSIDSVLAQLEPN